MKTTLWRISFFSSIFGALCILSGLLFAKSAIQQCAGAAVGLALSVVPVCLAFAAGQIDANGHKIITKDTRTAFILALFIGALGVYWFAQM
jgi:prepilin signal peptidase PulO-like enzyme (type II secretory pathway)